MYLPKTFFHVKNEVFCHFVGSNCREILVLWVQNGNNYKVICIPLDNIKKKKKIYVVFLILMMEQRGHWLSQKWRRFVTTAIRTCVPNCKDPGSCYSNADKSFQCDMFMPGRSISHFIQLNMEKYHIMYFLRVLWCKFCKNIVSKK